MFLKKKKNAAKTFTENRKIREFDPERKKKKMSNRKTFKETPQRETRKKPNPKTN